MVRPESAGRGGLHPSGDGARVGSAREHPGGLVGIAAVVGIEGQVNSLSNIHEVRKGVLQGQLLKGLGVEVIVGRGIAPVSV